MANSCSASIELREEGQRQGDCVCVGVLVCVPECACVCVILASVRNQTPDRPATFLMSSGAARPRGKLILRVAQWN